MDTSFYQRPGTAPVVDIGGAATKGMTLQKLMTETQFQPQVIEQQLASSRAAQAATEAATATTLENLARTKYENESTRKLAAILKNNYDKTGKINFIGAATDAAAEGLDPSTVFTYLEKANTTAQGQIKTDEDKLAYGEKVLKPVYDLLRAAPPGTAPTILNGTQSLLSKVMGDEGSKNFLQQRLGLSKVIPLDEQGLQRPPDMNVLDQYLRTVGQTNARALSISPLAEVTTGQAAEQITQAGVTGVAGPAARDPRSPASRAAQDAAIAAMPEMNPADIRKLSASDIQYQLGITGPVIANVVPSGTKAAAQATAAVAKTTAMFYDKLAAAAQKVGNRYGKEVVVANIISGQIQKKIIDDPDTAELIALVKEAEAKGIKLEPNANPASLAQIARGQAKLARETAAEQEKISGKTKFKTSEVRVKRLADGKIISVPAEDAAKLLADPRFERAQ